MPRKFAILAILLVSPACATVPEAGYQSRNGVVIRALITRDQGEKLDEILDALPKPLINSILFITTNDDDRHYSIPNAGGDCHWNGQICVKTPYLNNHYIIWHEVAHAYHFSLNRKLSRFSVQWSDLFDEVCRHDGWKYPKCGILTEYGANNIYEDVAVWTGEFYSRLRWGWWGAFLSSNRLAFKSDPRFKEKLTLLRDYGFISDKDYKEFLDLDLLRNPR